MDEWTVVMGWAIMGGLERVGDERVLRPQELLYSYPVDINAEPSDQKGTTMHALEEKLHPSRLKQPREAKSDVASMISENQPQNSTSFQKSHQATISISLAHD